MPRSPLLSMLRAAVRDLISPESGGAPTPALLPGAAAASRAAAELAPGRRRFLQLSAALVGTQALSACAGKPTMSSGKTVGIVGGGLAGLHCAYRLKKLGVRATVYEAARRTGGRIRSDRVTFPDGQSAELGGEWIDSSDRAMRDLAAELGVDLIDYQKDDPTLASLIGWAEGARLSEAQLLDGLKPIATRVSAALATLRDATVRPGYRNTNGADALDQLSISQWLDQAGAMGAVRRLVEVAYTVEFGLDAGAQSALNLILTLSPDAAKPGLFADSDRRFRARYGSDAFITKLENELLEGSLQRDAMLLALRKTSDGRLGLTLGRSAGGAFEVSHDHVVLAIPFTTLRNVSLAGLALPPPKLRAIQELGQGTGARLLVGFRGRVWRTSMSNGSALGDLDFQTLADQSRLQPGNSGLLASTIGGARGRDFVKGKIDQQVMALLADVDKLYPGAKTMTNDRFARVHWPSEPFAGGSRACYLPGQWTAFGGAEGERVENLHFCGEHTSREAQGSMEGAARSGAAAAMAIAADLGTGGIARLAPPGRRRSARTRRPA